MAYPYVRRECAEGKGPSTLILDCSSSETVRLVEVDAAERFELVANIQGGSLDRSQESAPLNADMYDIAICLYTIETFRGRESMPVAKRRSVPKIFGLDPVQLAR